MNVPDRTVSREFRESLAKELPGLADNKAYWRMTCHLLFGTLCDVNTDQLALPREFVAAIERRKFNSHYAASPFLNAFRRDVLNFKIAEHKFSRDGEGRVKTVESLVLPGGIQEIVNAERRNKDPEGRVWMSSGSVWLRKHAAAARQDDRDQAQALQSGQSGQARLLLEYMNSLPSHRFTSALKHLPEAMAAAEHLKDSENQLNLLGAIRDHAQPFYKSVDKTTRVFSLRESVLRLHRDLRKIMTQGWLTADLRSAQLAVVAKVWEIPSLTTYLKAEKKIWPDLCHHMKMTYSDENKAVLKEILYALIFGAGNATMLREMAKHFANASAAFKLLKTHPVIRALVLARCRQLRKIRYEEGGTDAFGTKTALVKRRKDGYDYEYDNARSILACIAQSYELKLLLPVVRMAVAEQFDPHGFTITTWLHDGFTYDAHDSGDIENWQKKILLTVQAEADTLGIITKLEFE